MAVPLVPTQATAPGKSPVAASFTSRICESYSPAFTQAEPSQVARPMRSMPSPRPNVPIAIRLPPGSVARSTKCGTEPAGAAASFAGADHVEEPDAFVENQNPFVVARAHATMRLPLTV